MQSGGELIYCKWIFQSSSENIPLSFLIWVELTMIDVSQGILSLEIIELYSYFPLEIHSSPSAWSCHMARIYGYEQTEPQMRISITFIIALLSPKAKTFLWAWNTFECAYRFYYTYFFFLPSSLEHLQQSGHLIHLCVAWRHPILLGNSPAEFRILVCSATKLKVQFVVSIMIKH